MTALDDLIKMYENICNSCHEHLKKSCKDCRIPELIEKAKNVNKNLRIKK